MQLFQVVCRGISHESLVFSWYKHEPLAKCVYLENTSSDSCDIPWHTTGKGCITILYHVIENTVASKAQCEGWV